MKKIHCFAYIVLLVFLTVNAMAERKILLDGLIAKVNEHFITIGDVMLRVQPLQRQLMVKYKGEELRRETRKIFEKSLDNLIENKLIIDAYKAQKGQIPEWVVDNRINEILHNIFKDDRTAMMRALADDNLTYEKWKTSIRNQIITSSMRQANVTDRIKISAVDVQNYYDLHLADYTKPSMVRLQMIVIKVSAEDDEESGMKKATILRARLKLGEDFYKVAKENSEDDKASRGGDWGWLSPEDLRPELAKAIKDLKEGDISDVIKTDESIYIAKIFALKPGSVESFSDAREDIEKKLRNKQGQRIHKEWILSLKKNAQVEIMDIDPFAGN